MSERQYIGARYVPKFADPIDWNGSSSYDALTIVKYFNSSYTSRKAVPSGIEISNTNYWVCTGNFNAQLETLIELVSEAAKSYGTINDLIADVENLASGEIIRVNGFYSEGDGGEGYIEILENEPAGAHIELGEKYGKPLVSGYVVPEMFGAYGDDIHDDSAVINSIIATYKFCQLTPGKTYLCESKIEMPANSFFDGCNGNIHSSASIAFEIQNYTSTQTHNAQPVYLKNTHISGTGANTLIKLNKCLKCYITECELTNFYIGIDYVEGYEANVSNCHMIGGASTATGIKCASSGGDSVFENIVIRDCKTAINVSSANNYFNGIHAWILNPQYVTDSVMILDQAVGGLTNTYNDIYCDTYAHLIEKTGTSLSLFDRIQVHVNTSIIDQAELTSSYLIVYGDSYNNYMGGKVCLYHLTMTNTRPQLYTLANKTDIYIPISLEKVSSETMTMLNDFNGLSLFTVENGVTLGETSKISIINDELHGFLDATLPADWTTYKRALSVKNGGISFPSTLQIMRKVDNSESSVVSGTTIGDYIQIRGAASTRYYVYLNASVRGLA